MNKTDIIRMARMVGIDSVQQYDSDTPATVLIERFAGLIASAEREACANICETLELPEWPDKVRQPLAQAIRARGQA